MQAVQLVGHAPVQEAQPKTHAVQRPLASSANLPLSHCDVQAPDDVIKVPDAHAVHCEAAPPQLAHSLAHGAQRSTSKSAKVRAGQAIGATHSLPRRTRPAGQAVQPDAPAALHVRHEVEQGAHLPSLEA